MIIIAVRRWEINWTKFLRDLVDVRFRGAFVQGCNLAKTGAPSRAEITDAAMGERGRVRDVDKGPQLAQAVRMLADILCRMELHRSKKSARLRRLHLAAMTPGGARDGDHRILTIVSGLEPAQNRS